MDERDVIFCRMRYKEKSDIYNDYYQLRPEKKKQDDYLRSLPSIGDEKNKWYDDVIHPFINSGFEMIENMSVLNKNTVSKKQVDVDAKEMSIFIKEILSKMGARAKIINCTDEFFYSTKARPDFLYGKSVEKDYKSIIVFSMPMDLDNINNAPLPKEMIATVMQYMQGTYISIWLSNYINSLGYKAKANYDGNYDLVLPLVAEKAGLGQIGYNGILIDENYGPRVRLGAVLCDLELEYDNSKIFNFNEICSHCNLCIDKCLANAIRLNKTPIVQHEKCYERWRIYGTDCSICTKVCPFSQEIYQKYKGKLNNIEVIKKFINEHKNMMSTK